MAATKAILTTAVVYVRNLLLGAGSGTAVGSPGITLFVSDNAVTTTAGDLTTLISYTLPGGTMANDGDIIEITGSTTQAADTDNKLSALTFGGSTVAIRSGAADNNLPRTLRAQVIRKSGTTQVSDGVTQAQGQGTNVTHATPAETLSGDIVISLKGQNQTDTTSPSVTSRFLTVTYYPIGRAANFS